MIKIIAGLDPMNGIFNISVKSPLVTKYFPNLCGMIKDDKECPEGLTIEKLEKDTAIIKFPISQEDIVMRSEEEGTARVSPGAASSVSSVISIVRRFAICSVRSILKRSEFLPILDFSGGYSFEELQKDVISAAKNKRQYIVIDSYQNYLTNTKDMKYEFNQYIIPFGTSEYCDFLLLARAGKLKEIRETYKPKLKKTSWF